VIGRAVPVVAGLAAAALVFAAVMIATDDDGGGASDGGGTLARSDGREVFARMGCGGCHTLAASGSVGRIGPDLDVQLDGHTRESLIAKIVAPGPSLMPDDFGARMSAGELDALVEFLLAARRP
jgi:mono/diheme cytochrome c family protein